MKNENECDKLLIATRVIIVIAVLTYGITELLSVFKAVNRLALSLFWAAIIIFMFILLFRIYGIDRIKTMASCAVGMIRRKREPLEWVILFFALVSVITACITIPYNYDSMTYHLARIAHWEQNGSIAHYGTNILRQVSSPVFAEIVGLHLYILSGHMLNILNLIQTLSFIFIAFTIDCMCRILEINKGIRCMTVILFMTMPIAFAESVSTQNDLVASMWYVFFIMEIVCFLRRNGVIALDKESVISVLSMAALIGLIYLTKPSAIFGVIIFLIFAVPIIMKKADPVMVIISCLIAGLTIVVIIFPEIYRNYVTFGSFSASNVSSNIMIGSFAPGVILLNFMKNFTMNLPTRISPYISMGIEAFLKIVSHITGVSLDDPRIHFEGSFILNDPLAYNHDYAINPLTEWLFIIGMVVLLIMLFKKGKGLETIRSYIVLSGLISFCVFCVFLKYQPWGTRLMLPYLSVLCFACGILLDSMFALNLKNSEFIMTSVTAVILFLAISGGLNSVALQVRCAVKAFWGNRALYASVLPLYDEDRMIADKIIHDGYKTIGFSSDENDYEFPLFVMLDKKVDGIYHVEIENMTSVYEEDVVPDCIIWKRDLPGDGVISIHDTEYEAEMNAGETYLLTKKKTG